MGYRHGDIQEVTLTRDCPAVAVPWGSATTLEAGRVGYISQQLGGTFTVMVDGNLYRIDGRHADALGLELEPSEELALGVGNGAPTTAEAVEAAAWKLLAGVSRESYYDNLATAVAEHDSRLVRFHPRFLAFAREYNFVPRACNPASGWEKGKVERGGIPLICRS